MTFPHSIAGRGLWTIDDPNDDVSMSNREPESELDASGPLDLGREHNGDAQLLETVPSTDCVHAPELQRWTAPWEVTGR